MDSFDTVRRTRGSPRVGHISLQEVGDVSGSGDLVDSSVAGGNYGYALMWALVLALFVRFVFVSIIAKYQLCNQHGENVLARPRR